MHEHRDSPGEIRDPGRTVDFRARFADDIFVELSFPEKDVVPGDFLTTLANRISDYLASHAPPSIATSNLLHPKAGRTSTRTERSGRERPRHAGHAAIGHSPAVVSRNGPDSWFGGGRAALRAARVAPAAANRSRCCWR